MPSVPSVIGRYEIRERLGQGGMGTLYLALDPAIDRLVALKLLRVDNDEMRARFLREARSAGRLQHSHIVTVYDVGEHEGQPFIAMEYINGETLGEMIQRRAPTSVSRKLTLMEELCEGLAYAHNAGLVHRDIKPANLMITTDGGTLKVLDFGIARGSGDSGLTEVGTMMGTPNYMSPEQASGKPVDQRSDIFAVGAVIYETLVYRQAFPGKEWQVVLPNILQGSPEPMTRVDRRLDPSLEGIVGRAMARNPEDRYHDLSTLGHDLAECRRRLDSASAETATPVPAPSPTPGGTTPRLRTDRKRLDSLRKEKVRAHVQAAGDALNRGNVEAAQAAAEEASLLDAEDTQVLRLLAEVQQAYDAHQVDTSLAAARERLEAEALTEALKLVDQALAFQPTAPTARGLRQTVVQAIEERNRQRERARVIDRALCTAREALEAGTPEAVIRSVSEVLAYDPTHREAAALKRRALIATETRRQQEAAERQARQAVATARREFAAGDHTAAIKRLEDLDTAHPIVTSTLTELREEAAAIEGPLRSGQAEEQRSAAWVAEQLEAVREAIASEQWDEAATRTDELRAKAPQTPELPALAADVEQGQLAARRRLEIAEYLTQARQRLTAKDYPGALAMVDAVLALWHDHPEAAALRTEIERQASTEEQRREEEATARRQARQARLAEQLDTATAALRDGDHETALQALREADQDAATTTQAMRIRELERDAKDQKVAAEAEAVQQRERRREESRQRRAEQAARLSAMVRHTLADRRVLAGGGVVAVIAVALLVMLPSAPAPESPPEPPPQPLTALGIDFDGVALSSGMSPGVGAPMGAPLAPADRLPDALEQGVAGALDLSGRGDFTAAFQHLETLDQQDARVMRAGQQVEQAWNQAAQDVADRSRQLAASGEFGEALVLITGFEPEHGFVLVAREEVEVALAVDARATSRRALEIASSGGHDDAVALLEAYAPPHDIIRTTLDELLANPQCSEELPRVRDGMMSWATRPGVAMPAAIEQACDGSFRIDIQNERVRFGAGCGRASATVFIPVLCDGASE